jgi:hypothetical protein
LEEKNLKRECLPECVGGTWTYDQFTQWFEQETKIRRNQSIDSTLKKSPPLSNAKRKRGKGTMPVNGQISLAKAPKTQREFKMTSSSTKGKEKLQQSNVETVNVVKTVPVIGGMQGIPLSEKMEYLEAMERCPLLVATESCPLQFLKLNNNDATFAAQKLSYYWQRRKSLFGQDLAFRPVFEWAHFIVGNDKCSILEIESLERPILYFEPLICGNGITNLHLLHQERSLFYNLARIMCRPEGYATGVDLVLVLTLDDVDLSNTLLATLQNIFTTRFASISFLLRPEENNSQNISKLTTTLINKIIGPVENDVQFHIGLSLDDVLLSLARRGQSKNIIRADEIVLSGNDTQGSLCLDVPDFRLALMNASNGQRSRESRIVPRLSSHDNIPIAVVQSDLGLCQDVLLRYARANHH